MDNIPSFARICEAALQKAITLVPPPTPYQTMCAQVQRLLGIGDGPDPLPGKEIGRGWILRRPFALHRVTIEAIADPAQVKVYRRDALVADWIDPVAMPAAFLYAVANRMFFENPRDFLPVPPVARDLEAIVESDYAEAERRVQAAADPLPYFASKTHTGRPGGWEPPKMDYSASQATLERILGQQPPEPGRGQRLLDKVAATARNVADELRCSDRQEYLEHEAIAQRLEAMTKEADYVEATLETHQADCMAWWQKSVLLGLTDQSADDFCRPFIPGEGNLTQAAIAQTAAYVRWADAVSRGKTRLSFAEYTPTP